MRDACTTGRNPLRAEGFSRPSHRDGEVPETLPGPFRCGSTTCKINPVASAALKALPPRSSIPNPTALAIQWVEVTAPNIPAMSGRVVNAMTGLRR